MATRLVGRIGILNSSYEEIKTGLTGLVLEKCRYPYINNNLNNENDIML